MKYSELELGETYAFQRGKYSRAYPATVLDLERTPTGRKNRQAGGYRYTQEVLGVKVSLKGEEQVVEPRYLTMTWEAYQVLEAEAQARHDAIQAAKQAASAAAVGLAAYLPKAEEISTGAYGRQVVLTTEQAEALLALLGRTS